jgi:putative holliday junction resolvase
VRVLGVDFGGKRIGIAAGETEHKIASPRAAIAASGTLRIDAGTIAEIARSELVDSVIVGVPLDDEGGETKMSRICRMLGSEIEKTGFSVNYIDESLTSVAAQSALRNHDLTAAQRRKHIDSEAACRILERFFEGGNA